MAQLKNTRSLHRTRGGFTLVEVIVVLVILALLAAITVPAYTSYTDRARERICGLNCSQLKRDITLELLMDESLSARVRLKWTDLSSDFRSYTEDFHCPSGGRYEIFINSSGEIEVGCSRHSPIAGMSIQRHAEDTFKRYLSDYPSVLWVSGTALKNYILTNSPDKIAPMGRISVNGISYVVKPDMQTMAGGGTPVGGTQQAVTICAGTHWGRQPGQNDESTFNVTLIYNDRNNTWYQYTKSGAPAVLYTGGGKSKAAILDSTTSPSQEYFGGVWKAVTVEYTPPSS